MNESELANYFEARRGDTSAWSSNPIKATVRRGNSVVFSLRLRPDELDALRTIAETYEISVSDLIRSSMADLLSESGSSCTIRARSLSLNAITVQSPTAPADESRGSSGAGRSVLDSTPRTDFVIVGRTSSSLAA